jgi:hypothetical protein
MPVLGKYTSNITLSPAEKIWVSVMERLLNQNRGSIDEIRYQKKINQFSKENIITQWEKVL